MKEEMEAERYTPARGVRGVVCTWILSEPGAALNAQILNPLPTPNPIMVPLP